MSFYYNYCLNVINSLGSPAAIATSVLISNVELTFAGGRKLLIRTDIGANFYSSEKEVGWKFDF